MTSFFLCGSVLGDHVLEFVLDGSGNAVDRIAAQMPGVVLPDAPMLFGLPGVEDGARADGVVLRALPEVATRRMCYFLSAIGAELRDGLAEIGEERVPVRYATGQGMPCDLFEPEACARIEHYASEEIMSYYGRLEAETVANRRAMILARAAARQAAEQAKPANIRSSAGIDRVEVHQQDSPHEGFFLTRSYQLQHPKFDGTTSEVVAREVFVATDAAIVLPYDPVRDRVLLVEQFRMGPFGRGDVKPWVLEPVAGRVDAGETPEACARRECREEAGLALRELLPISSHYCSPGCSTEYFHLFLGLCDLPEEAAGLGGLETEHEDLHAHVIDYDAAMALLDTGEADNGPLVLSLLWLSKTRDSLRASA